MMAWIWSQCLPLTCLLGLLLLLRPLLLKYAGARFQYSLWWAVPLWLLISILPEAVWPPLANEGITKFSVVAGKLNASIAQQAAELSWLALLWLVGVALLGLIVQCQYRALQRALSSTETSELLGVAVQYSHHQQGPLVCGLWRPILLLPQDFTLHFSTEQQQLIIAHELAHWRRGDLHANVLAMVLLAVFWFHPLSWLAYRAYRQDQELACDAQVLQAASPEQKIAYSYALLSITQSRASTWQLLTNHYGDKMMMKQRLLHLQRQQGFSKTTMVVTLALLTSAMVWLQQPVLANAGTDKIAPVMRVEPGYPTQAAQAKINGYVEAEFDIQPDGKVQNVKIIQSVPEKVFDKEAVRALQKWSYAPSAAGKKKEKVRLEFVLDTTAEEIETVQVTPAGHK